MREGVGADDRLVRLDDEARRLRHKARGRDDLRGVDVHVQPEVVAPRLHGHDDLL